MSVGDLLRKTLRQWSAKGYTRWIRRIVLWGVYCLIIRYVIVSNFYQDSPFIMSWIVTGLMVQTITIYYVFALYILPQYVYNFKFTLFALFFIGIHSLVYWSNYLLFWYISKFPHGVRAERDWNRLYEAGLFGFMTDGVASFWSFFYSYPFAIILLTVRAIQDITVLRTKNLLLERDKLNLELDFLKAQVNPHFLFNTLNNVYADVFDSNEKAADLILRLSELMRYNLYETDQPKIALDKELRYIQNYLDLERNRLSDQNVVIDYEQTGDAAAYQIVPLLLIAFVENAFKHGIKGATNPAYVQVTAEVSGNSLLFTVENSIPPKRAVTEGVFRSGGVGLGNVRRRLDALYPKSYALDVMATEDTYTVSLLIQIEAIR